MAISCLICGGTLKTALGEPCPECTKKEGLQAPVVAGIPLQYQGVNFDKSFLPQELQKDYGTFMEDLLITIVNDIAFYQKNLIICSRPNSGKTVWAYTLYARLIAKGFETPPLMDIVEARDALNTWDNKEKGILLSSARCAVIKIPRDMQFWMFDTMSYILERRVRSNGFTIFLFGGSLDDLNAIDRKSTLSVMRGTGAYNTVKIHSY